jgi:DNA replication protein DnaC
MGQFPENQPRSVGQVLGERQPDRDAHCPEHGAFVSSNIFAKVWSKCPACSAAEEAAAQAEASQRAAKAADDRHSEAIAQARIPARFVGRTFDNFVAETDDQRHALTVARDFAERFDFHAKRGAWLVLSGMPGTGKSHLAAAILQTVLSRHVRYMTCLDLIRSVRETWRRDSEKSESQVLAYLSGLDLLAIDEVGMQYGTDGEQTILFDVLDRRYRDVKPTILMTNQDMDGLKSSLGDRTHDRLREVGRLVLFEWPSYRPTARREGQ